MNNPVLEAISEHLTKNGIPATPVYGAHFQIIDIVNTDHYIKYHHHKQLVQLVNTYGFLQPTVAPIHIEDLNFFDKLITAIREISP